MAAPKETKKNVEHMPLAIIQPGSGARRTLKFSDYRNANFEHIGFELPIFTASRICRWALRPSMRASTKQPPM